MSSMPGVMDGPFIIDMALPGVIQKGLTTFDSIGAFLVGREPVILAGTPEPWMMYKGVCIL